MWFRQPPSERPAPRAAVCFSSPTRFWRKNHPCLRHTDKMLVHLYIPVLYFIDAKPLQVAVSYDVCIHIILLFFVISQCLMKRVMPIKFKHDGGLKSGLCQQDLYIVSHHCDCREECIDGCKLRERFHASSANVWAECVAGPLPPDHWDLACPCCWIPNTHSGCRSNTKI